MKILVPVDLYDSSFSSYLYAIHFAQLINAKITLLYVITSVYNTNDVIGYDPYIEMESTAKKRIENFKAKFEKEHENSLPKIETNLEVMFGIPGIAIAEIAESHKFDLIIMGIRDKHGILDRILGSASNETIKAADCPVILVHPSTEFKIPEKVLFAFDKRTDLEDALEDFKVFNNIIKAKTDFLHINLKMTNDDVNKQKAKIVSELFEKNDPKFAFEVKTLNGNNVINDLNEYCQLENVDVVCMIQRNEGIFSNFFRPNKSIKFVQQFHLPVIVFQED